MELAPRSATALIKVWNGEFAAHVDAAGSGAAAELCWSNVSDQGKDYFLRVQQVKKDLECWSAMNDSAVKNIPAVKKLYKDHGAKGHNRNSELKDLNRPIRAVLAVASQSSGDASTGGAAAPAAEQGPERKASYVHVIL